MITAEGGNKDWFSERAFHPITAGEHKGSPSKLPAAESLTYLEEEREGGEGGRLSGHQRLSANTACPLRSAPQPASPELRFTRPVFSN